MADVAHCHVVHTRAMPITSHEFSVTNDGCGKNEGAATDLAGFTEPDEAAGFGGLPRFFGATSVVHIHQV